MLLWSTGIASELAWTLPLVRADVDVSAIGLKQFNEKTVSAAENDFCPGPGILYSTMESSIS